MSDLLHGDRFPRSVLGQTSQRIALCTLLTLAIFAVDCTIILSPALSVLYILPLLIIANDDSIQLLLPWAAISVVLTLIGFTVGLPLTLGAMPLVNLAIGLTAIAITAQQLLQSARMRARSRDDERRYRDVFNSLAVAVWEYDFRAVDAAIAELRRAGITDLRQHFALHPESIAALRRIVAITNVNATALKLIGVPDRDRLVAQLADYLPETDENFADCIVAIAERPESFQTRTRLIAADGRVIEVIIAFKLGPDVALERVAASILDITEQTRLSTVIADTKDQLSRAQQAAAVGQISGSIAHELDQPLTAIQTSIGAAMRWLRPERYDVAEAKAALLTVSQAAGRAKEVIQRVRSLVGNAQMETTPQKIDDLVGEAILIVRGEIAVYGARLVQKLDAPGLIQADRILLQQVVANLIRNALQAMGSLPKPDRIVTVETTQSPGIVSVRVIDTGPGWADEIRNNAFQAFRTTKSEGMGLGLSICRTIIEAHEGRIQLGNSELGGASVEFSLPLIVSEP